MPIYFYSTREAYGCFSNFSPHGVELKGVWWPTTEHYFQAQKFAGTPHEEAIRLAKSPKQAAEMGRDRQRPLRADWEQVKDGIMREAVRQKFLTHKDIQHTLLDTGDSEIVENAPGDYYWGVGADGSGKNMLGIILMEVRTALQYDQQIDQQSDTAMIMRVIAVESEAFWNKDYATWARCWVQAPYIRTLGWWARGGVTVIEGWESLSTRIQELMRTHPEPNPTAAQVQRTRWNLRIAGEMAWLTFDQHGLDTGEAPMDMPGRSRETRILEKHNGEWKLVYVNWLLEGADTSDEVTREQRSH